MKRQVKKHLKSYKYATRGIFHTLRTQSNIWVQIPIGFLVIVAGFYYKLDKIEFGKVELKVLHTPGHTKGSITLLSDDVVFSGDTLFAGSIGRYDLPSGSLQEIMNSLKNKLMTLPDHVIVYPGHGSNSTIGKERRDNPFLQEDYMRY